MDERTNSQPFALAEAPGAALEWRRLVPALPLAAALVASVVAYWPALQSPLYADDYIYLNASRSLSFADYARASLTPLSDAPLLSSVSLNYWRPLTYLSFGVFEPAFGAHPTPYHVVMLAIHLGSVVMVWLLARELSGRWEAAGVAAVLFAAHPAGFEGVSWISSVGNAGLPLTLAAWLAFARGSIREATRWPLIWLSALLFALALGFRESAMAVLPAMVSWRLLWWRRERLRESATYTPFLPLVAVLVIYELLRTRFLTEPAANSAAWELGDHAPGQFWYYLKVTALPVAPGSEGFAHLLQAGAGVLALGALPVLLLFRRWRIAAVVAGFLFAIAPYAPLTLGVSQRYAYFPAAFFALAVAIGFRELFGFLRTLVAPRWLNGSVAVLLALALVAGTLETNRRTRDWSASGPETQQAWVDELRATYPTLPAGGTLYCANTPLILALFGDVFLGPTVSFYYPGVAAERFEYATLPAVQSALGPDDRIFSPAATVPR